MRGYSFVEFLREQWETWPDLDQIDLVLAMGSSWSVYWEDQQGPIHAEQRLMKSAITRGIPVFGVCFGAQQLAVVLGGEVTKAQSPEIGWFSVENLPETAHLAPECLVEGRWMQWHYDRFSVPAGATVLAQSPVGPQALVCGRSLGVQFHPEATESIVRHWASGEGEAELRDRSIEVEKMMADTTFHVSSAEARCDRLVEWFLANVAQKHMD
jgi:GMP synthase-like glutamine amidotransferase